MSERLLMSVRNKPRLPKKKLKDHTDTNSLDYKKNIGNLKPYH